MDTADIPLRPLTCSPVILYVEDELQQQQLISMMLTELGYQVRLTASAEEALALVASAPPDLVLTGLLLHGMDGEQLLQRLRHSYPSIPVIVVSVENNARRAVKLLKEGASDFLTMPVELHELKERLETSLASCALCGGSIPLPDQSPMKEKECGIILGRSPAMLRVANQIPSLARTDASVLIQGESGTGKELFARAIHGLSHRATGPLVSVCCTAVNENLFDREFFGHAKGAFTDAHTGAPGYIEAANGGTLFLDELGDIRPEMQAKLLRFLQEKEYRKLGSTEVWRGDVRILCATNRDLLAACARGHFRQDLYYRIGVFILSLPPLRERLEDLPELATHFLERYGKAYGKPEVVLSSRAMMKLCSHDWPGNIRELENVIQQVVINARYGVIPADSIPVGDCSISGPCAGAEDLYKHFEPDVPSMGTTFTELRREVVEEFEEVYVNRLLALHKGNVTQAAAAAGLSRRTFARLMLKFGLKGGTDGKGRPGRPRGS